MSTTKSLADKLKAAPYVSDVSGKSMMLTDSNGNLSKINAELEYFKIKCRCLFGSDDVVLCGCSYNLSPTDWKSAVNREIDQWAGFTMLNSSPGTIAVVLDHTDDGKRVTLYARGMEATFNGLRRVANLMVEIEGFQPLWSTNVPPL